jgi:SAM-dependent methyltransferase
MHDSSYEKMEAFVRIHLAASRGIALDIIDFGSQTVDDQPRSYRNLFDDPSWSYRGLDIEHGANVDVVVANPYHWTEIPSDSVDVVVSGQAFEHVEYVWASMFEIARVLKPGGVAAIIAPSNGVEHRYPVDCWRFYRDGFVALASWVDCEVLDVFTDWNRAVWADSVLIARKPGADAEWRARFERRAALQRALLPDASPDADDAAVPTAVASSIDPEPSRLAPLTPGALETELAAIRAHHLAAEAETATATATEPGPGTGTGTGTGTASTAPAATVQPAGPVARGYGLVRAKIAGIAGERGRTAYKKLRGRV